MRFKQKEQNTMAIIQGLMATTGMSMKEALASMGLREKRPTISKYIPAGKRRNVELTKVRNPKVAAHVRAMHQHPELTKTAMFYEEY